VLLIAAFAIYVIVTKRLRISRRTVVTGQNARNFGICLLVLLIPSQVAIGAVLNVLLPRSARVWPIPQVLFVSVFSAVVLAMAFYFRDHPADEDGVGSGRGAGAMAFGFVDELRPAGDKPICVLARIRVLATEEGGREGPLRAKYRPNHNFGGPTDRNYFIGQVEIPDGEWIHPGETRDLQITFFNVVGLTEKLTPGRIWRVQEGPHLVATAELISIL
jgi:elongation factor Tu